MIKKERRKIIIENVQDVTSLGQMSKEELLLESEKYEPENYKPLENIDEKVILVPNNKTGVITIRVTQQENELLKKCASKNRISKSAFLRAVVLKAIKETSDGLDLTENAAKDDLLNSVLLNLTKKIEKIEKHTSRIDDLELKLLDMKHSLNKHLSDDSIGTYSSFDFNKILKNNQNSEASYGSFLKSTLRSMHYENEQN